MIVSYGVTHIFIRLRTNVLKVLMLKSFFLLKFYTFLTVGEEKPWMERFL